MLEMDQVLECKQLSSAGHGIRWIAKSLGISRNTVRAYVRGEREPEVYRLKERRKCPVRDKWRSRVSDLLDSEEQRETPRKQRLTAARIFRILESAGFSGSERTVRTLVGEVKLSLRDALKHAYLPLEYSPGQDAQVDFFEACVDYKDLGRTKVYGLLVRACMSGKTYAYIAPNQTQESLFEGLMRSFEYFGGVFRTVWFDNLTPAVKKVLKGRERIVQRAFERFSAHYGFEAVFCAPRAGNEKGGVEGAVKFCRHEIFSPIPIVQNRQEVQAIADAFMTREDGRTIVGRTQTIGEAFALERPDLLPLPQHRFPAGQVRKAKVSARSWISYGTNMYSVPVAWVGHEVDVRIEAETVTIRNRQEPPVRHSRLYGKHQMLLLIEHYLPLLERKVRAFDRAIPVKRWFEEAAPCWDLLLIALRKREGEVAGSRSFVSILQMCTTYGADQVECAIKKALGHPDLSPAVVRYFFRKEQELANPPSAPVMSYEGPCVRTAKASDYAGLQSMKEVHHG